MQRFTVSRDDRYHEAWPSVCIAGNGNLVCSYAEAIGTEEAPCPARSCA